MKKQALSLILALALLLSCVPLSARAEDVAAISGYDISIQPGEEATVWIQASGFGEISAVDFGIYSGSEQLEILSAEGGELLSGQFFDVNVTQESAVFSCVAAGTFGDAGTLATVRIRAAEDVPEGTYRLNIAVGDVWGADLTARTVACTPVKVTVQKQDPQEPSQTLRITAGSTEAHTVGDEFSLSFSGNYINNLGTLNLVTEYDNTILRLKDVALSDMLTGAGLPLYSINDTVPGSVRISYLSGNGVTGWLNSMVTYTFEVIANTDGYTVVTLEPESVYDGAGKAIQAQSAYATVNLYKTVEIPAAPQIVLEQVADTRDEFALQVKAQKDTAIAAGDFTVSFDPAALACAAVTPGKTGMVYSNIFNDDGKVKFSFILDGGISDDTVLCILRFEKKNDAACCDTPISITGKSVVNDDLQPVEVEYVGTSTHVHKYEPSVTAPTCTAQGYTVHTCDACGDSYVDSYVNALGHDWGEWTESTAPTCTEKGVETRSCGRCALTQTREIETLGHDLIDHDAKAPTCTEIGWEAYQTCSRCDYTTYTELPATGHTPGDTVKENEIAPTCTEKGIYDEVTYCTVCGVELSRETKEVDALGHDWSEWTVTTAPACTQKGVETRTCSRCNLTQTREIEALGHDLINHEAKAPTCTEIGWEAYQTCSRCDYTTYTELPSTGHTPGETVKENEIAPTCTEKGRYDEVIYCTVCGSELSRETKEVDALGHDYSLIGWTWTGYEKATATFVCANDESHVETMQAQIVERRTDPTCETDGEIRYTAVVQFNGEQYTDSKGLVIQRLGHNWGAPTYTWSEDNRSVTAEAICTRDPSHKLIETVWTTASSTDATCTEPGKVVFTASFENDLFETQSKTVNGVPMGHAWELTGWNWTGFDKAIASFTCKNDDSHVETAQAQITSVRTEPTCVTDGSIVYTAKVSFDGREYTDVKTQVLTKLGHDYTATVTLPTCTADGYTTHVCTRCGDTYTDTKVAALGHDWSEWTVTTAAACTEAGEETRSCARCDVRETRAIEALGHDLVEHEAKAPTCTEIGWEAYQTCNRCDYTTYAELPAVGHKPGIAVKENEIGPTCTEIGSYDDVVYCTVCNSELSRESKEVAALGHSFGDWSQTKAPSCTGPGEETRSCARCDVKETRAIDALGHDLVEHEAKAPTCTEIGWEAYQTCSRCDYMTYEELAALGHEYVEGVCIRCGAADPNYVPPVNKTELNEAIAEAEKVEKGKYTDESVAVLEEALASAKALPENADQAAIDAASGTLKSAIAGLVEKPDVLPEADKGELEKTIAAAEALAEEDYTPETFGVLKEALEAAKAVNDKEDATQEEVDAADKAVSDAIAALEKKPATHEDELKQAIDAAERVDKNQYTDDSVKTLEDAVMAGKAVLNKADATQNEIDTAAKAINDAIAALIKKPGEEPFRFDDVKNEKAFYFNPVYWAYEAKPQITNGIDKTHFGPDNGCTRGQVVTFLWRAAGCPEPASTETAFTDVGAKAFYAKAVAWAVEKGITKGMSETSFAPDATCTRGQIVTFLWRFRGSPAPSGADTGFTDVGAKAFYAKAVAWAVENKVTNGMTATTFAPNATCTRGQIVTFLYRAM